MWNVWQNGETDAKAYAHSYKGAAPYMQSLYEKIQPKKQFE